MRIAHIWKTQTQQNVTTTSACFTKAALKCFTKVSLKLSKNKNKHKWYNKFQAMLIVVKIDNFHTWDECGLKKGMKQNVTHFYIEKKNDIKCWHIILTAVNMMQFHYINDKAVNCLKHIWNRHPIAHLWGRAMGCLFCKFKVWSNHLWKLQHDIDGLVQDCSISSALAMEILQSCTKPSICIVWKEDIHTVKA